MKAYGHKSKNLVGHQGGIFSAMKPLLLQDKVIFLTGGSCGIGEDCANAYAAEGAKVIIVARDREGVEKVATKLGPEHMGIVCDITHDQEVKSAVEKALSRYGRLDAVYVQCRHRLTQQTDP